MKILLNSLLILFLTTSNALPLVAAEVADLYAAQVPLGADEKSARSAAISQALRQVLVKVTGDSNAPSHSGLAPLLRRFQSYVEQFRTVERTIGDAQQQFLWVQFDAEAINKSLRQAGLPIWGRARPLMLVWLAVEDGNRRYLLGSETDELMTKLISQAAVRRGIPFSLPLLDLEDQRAIEVTSVWGGFADTIIPASERYQPEAILVGRVFQDSREGVQARWSLYHNKAALHWQSSGYFPEEVIGAGVDGAVDAIAARFAPVAVLGDPDEVLIRVESVASLADYARTVSYLESLSTVERTDIKQVDADSLVVQLSLRNDVAALMQAVKLGNTLAPIPKVAFTAVTGPNSASQSQLPNESQVLPSSGSETVTTAINFRLLN